MLGVGRRANLLYRLEEQESVHCDTLLASDDESATEAASARYSGRTGSFGVKVILEPYGRNGRKELREHADIVLAPLQGPFARLEGEPVTAEGEPVGRMGL
jgi:hypothetical protein